MLFASAVSAALQMERRVTHIQSHTHTHTKRMCIQQEAF